MQNLLSVKNGGFYYIRDNFLFRNLNFSLSSGQTLAILGINAQGKSTLMFCMMGIFNLKEGETKTQAKFGFLPQNFSVAFDYKVLDIVLIGRIREISLFSKPSKDDIEICIEALKSLEITHLNTKASTRSQAVKSNWFFLQGRLQAGVKFCFWMN